jgi:hypothetical protein
MQALFLLRIEAPRSMGLVTRLTHGLQLHPSRMEHRALPDWARSAISPALPNSAPTHVTETDANHRRQYHAQRQGRITDVQ